MRNLLMDSIVKNRLIRDEELEELFSLTIQMNPELNQEAMLRVIQDVKDDLDYEG